MVAYWHRWQKPLIPLLLILTLAFTNYVVQALPQPHFVADDMDYILTGQLLDEQGQPISTAVIYLGDTETESQENGAWTLALAELPDDLPNLVIERPHFAPMMLTLDTAVRQQLQDIGSYNVGTLTMARHISVGFWVATLAFILVLLFIAFEKLHSTTASLVGVSLIFTSTFIGRAFAPTWFIFDFEQALRYINWEVIFLVMAMMIIIAIIEETGIFQWMAFQAYRLSRGRLWLLVLILILVTAVASALLDNFTTMLLMTPISLQIGIALGINPLALIIPEVLASNVGGISTLIGTPTNILIGAYANIGFSDFLINQTVGVIVALIFMAAFILYHYRRELFQGGSGISPVLYDRLQKNAQIEQPMVLAKASFVFILVMVGFVIGERYHIVPRCPCSIGCHPLAGMAKTRCAKND